jgi:flagellar motor switch protein FliN
MSENPVANEAGTAVDAPAAPADFEELSMSAGPAPGQEAGLSSLYDLTMPVSIELGRTKMTVQELLSLGRGSVIQLERLAGEPMDVFVGDRRFAEGEVVVIGEQFGVRITRVLPPSNRQLGPA